MILSQDVLSKIFLFADAKELGRIAAVSKAWKAVLGEREQTIWESLMENRYPRLARLVRLGPDVENGYSWKKGFKTRSSSPFEPVGVNRDLQKDLETVFSPRGIVAFTNCCKIECSGAYNEVDESFRVRQDDGIYFIRFTLNGMNYSPDKYVMFAAMSNKSKDKGDSEYCFHGIAISYGSLEYLYEHWEQEQQLIAQFCAVIGLEEGEFKIHKPKSIRTCIMVENYKPLQLEPMHWGESDFEEDDEEFEVDDDDEEFGVDDDEVEY